MNIRITNKFCIFALSLLAFQVHGQSIKSSIPTVEINGILWDQHEMTIGEVKRFANATGFLSAAEKAGGGTSYELGFVKKPGWTWRTPYGVPAGDNEPAVHLNAFEAQSICQFFGKRLPSDQEWVEAAYLEQRNSPPMGFQKGQRYPYPNGANAKGSHCLGSSCGNYKGLAPAGSLNRGDGHVEAALLSLGSMVFLIWAAMYGSGRQLKLTVSELPVVHLGGMGQNNNLKTMWLASPKIPWLSILDCAAFAQNNWCPRPESNRHALFMSGRF